jgi:transcriptional regulator with XRE-family HTH domain
MNTDNTVSDSLKYNPEKGTYRARFEIDTISPTIAVLEMVAEVEGVDPVTLPPFAETDDPQSRRDRSSTDARRRERAVTTVRGHRFLGGPENTAWGNPRDRDGGYSY